MAEQPPRSTHKFGGASVKDAAAIRRVGQLLSDHLREEEQAVVVVSAMGKTTNALEAVWRSSGSEQEERWAEISQAHFDVASELGLEVTDRLQSVFEASWQEAQSAQQEGLTEASYDAFVSAGELASTTLVAAWCVAQGLDTVWWDVRETVHTSGPHRHARVDEATLWENGASLRSACVSSRVVVTQGFIGRHASGRTATLGREGSDYSAALLAVAVGAESVTIWKDVPGMMNADPKWHPEAQTVPRVDHAEAIELSYYGASVIHPRTVKPLQQRGLPLWIRSFLAPEGPATLIDDFPGLVPDQAMFIWRDDQVWVEVATADQSFLAEDHLKDLFSALDRAGVHVRMMQQHATHFGLLTDRDDLRLHTLEELLGQAFQVRREDGLLLLTVRHGDSAVLQELTAGREVVVEQVAGVTRRRLMRN